MCLHGSHPQPSSHFPSPLLLILSPPGHGDVYRSLEKSGVLDKLLAAGKEYVFISNVDNLNAAIDLRLLYHLVNNRGVSFCMEVTERTRQDVQGGTLVEYEGKPHLLEASQVPPQHWDDLRSLKKFRTWCTNNLWVSLKEMKEIISVRSLDWGSPVIVNERIISSAGRGTGGVSGETGGGLCVNGGGGLGRGGGIPILELETAAGGAIGFFPGAIGVLVPRSRFLPVKNTGDLFAVQSNLYDLRHGILYMAPARSIHVPPIIRLGPEFSTLEDYTERVLGGSGGLGTPDILEADHISVTGNVTFGKGVSLRGSVVIVATEGQRIDVPSGALLENCVVTGSLRITSTT